MRPFATDIVRKVGRVTLGNLMGSCVVLSISPVNKEVTSGKFSSLFGYGLDRRRMLAKEQSFIDNEVIRRSSKRWPKTPTHGNTLRPLARWTLALGEISRKSMPSRSIGCGGCRRTSIFGFAFFLQVKIGASFRAQVDPKNNHCQIVRFISSRSTVHCQSFIAVQSSKRPCGFQNLRLGGQDGAHARGKAKVEAAASVVVVLPSSSF